MSLVECILDQTYEEGAMYANGESIKWKSGSDYLSRKRDWESNCYRLCE